MQKALSAVFVNGFIMLRRGFIGLIGFLPVLGALNGCGFRPRSAPSYDFESIYLNVPLNSSLGRELLRALSLTHSLQIITPVEASSSGSTTLADVTLHLHGEDYSQLALAKTASGQVRELQLRLDASFSLTGNDGRVWMPETIISQQREMSYSETLALAKDEEVQGLLADMRQDIAQQVLRRLALLKKSDARY